MLPGTKPGIRRIILQRNQRRKSPSADPARRPQHREITATAQTQSYETEAQRQKLSIKMADLAQTRLTFIVDAPLAVYGWVIERLAGAIHPDAASGEIPELPILEKNRDD